MPVDFARIEQELGIVLPAQYRQTLEARAATLRELGMFDIEYPCLYLKTQEIIEANRYEQDPGSDVANFFPQWWETYFIAATNGGGDYYCLRLDNAPGVWMIGSDCGLEPTQEAESFAVFVEGEIARQRECLNEEANENERSGTLEDEIAAHRAAIHDSGSHEDAETWLDHRSGYVLMKILHTQAFRSPRKLRLFGLACCALVPDLLEDSVCSSGIALANRMARESVPVDEVSSMRSLLREGLQQLMRKHSQFAPEEEYRSRLWRLQAVYHLFQDDDVYRSDGPIYPGDPELEETYREVSNLLDHGPYGSDVELNLLREIIGNPVCPVDFSPDWRTPAVVELARMIEVDEAFHRMPELALLLEAAGCTNRRVLAHCERKEGHVRGCWVIDEILYPEASSR